MPRLCPLLMTMAMATVVPVVKRQRCGWKGKRNGNRNGNQPKYLAKFVKDTTLPDGSVMAPGQTYTKTWTVCNSGKVDWPRETALLHVGGDMELRPTAPRIPVGTVKPGSEIQISVGMTAPPVPGRYWSYWRLVDGDAPAAQRFGLRLWADVTVAPAKEETAVVASNTTMAAAPPASKVKIAKEIVKEDLPLPPPPTTLPPQSHRQPKPVAMTGLAVPSSLDQPMLGTAAVIAPAPAAMVTSPSAPPQPVVSTAVAVPVPDNVADTAAATDLTPLEQAVEILSAMGFDKAKFQTLLKRHNGDIQKVVLELLK